VQKELPAIPARHNRIGGALVYWGLIRWGVWSHFDRVWLKVVGQPPQPVDGPLLVYLNHPSWWDGYMCMLLNRLVLRDQFQGYLMMEEPQLRRYCFFRWVGCFSVDRHNARSAARSVAYAARLLAERPNRSVYLFPQGVLTPNERRPLELYPGLAHIVRRAGGATLWPVALRYEFRGEQRPEAFLRAGPAHRVTAETDVQTVMADTTHRLTAATDALRDEVAADALDDYRVLLRGRTGVNRLFDRIRGLDT
jgi:chlorobactene lauroyltransferase